MKRVTEYHQGVAVIKNKNFKGAAEKLARVEDLAEKWKAEAEKDPHSYLHLDFIVKMLEGGGSDE